jgi:hypothetical protein
MTEPIPEAELERMERESRGYRSDDPRWCVSGDLLSVINELRSLRRRARPGTWLRIDLDRWWKCLIAGALVFALCMSGVRGWMIVACVVRGGVWPQPMTTCEAATTEKRP